MKKARNKKTARARAIKIIKEKKGIIRTSEAIQSGIHPRILYQLRDDGIIEQLTRGVYHLKSDITPTDIDIATIAKRIPRAVICLISALSFHDITTQIPHTINFALKKGDERPRMNHPPVSIYWFSDKTYESGIEDHVIDGIPVKIYNPEKTIADCFKFRNKIGIDVVLEALKLYKQRKKFKPAELTEYAKICRVDKIMRPYLEAIL